MQKIKKFFTLLLGLTFTQVEAKTIVSELELKGDIVIPLTEGERIIKKISDNQKKELTEILNKFDLQKDGTPDRFPFAGILVTFKFKMNGKYYFLSMISNRFTYKGKVFALRKLDSHGKVIWKTERIFSSPELYSQIKANILKHAKLNGVE